MSTTSNSRIFLLFLSVSFSWALRAQQATLVHGFTGTDGANPSSSLIELPNGNLMGTTWNSQTAKGTIYTLDSNAVLTTTYTFPSSFCAGRANAITDSGLFQASNGLVYGVCYGGGQSGYGSVYVVSKSGQNAKLLHSFNGTDGSHPLGPLVEGSDGNLYGVTSSTVFKMTPNGTVSVLYTFVKKSGAWDPLGGLTLGSDQNLYGISGYDDNSFEGSGYQVNPAGGLNVLGNFYAAPFGQSPVLTATNAVETICQPTLGIGAGETVETVSAGDNKHVVYQLPQYFGPDFVNLVGGLAAGGDGALYLNGASIVTFPPPVNPYVIARIDIPGNNTQFAGVIPTLGSTLVGNPLQTASGTIYSAAQSGGPNGLGSIVSVNFGSPAPNPGISFFQPTIGSPKTVVTLWGSHFVGATSVTVGGVPVPFTTVASGFIKFAITPAAMTGPVAVTTAGGTVASTGTFTVQ